MSEAKMDIGELYVRLTKDADSVSCGAKQAGNALDRLGKVAERIGRNLGDAFKEKPDNG